MNIYETGVGRMRQTQMEEIRADIEKLLILDNDTIQPTENENVFRLDPRDETVRPWTFPILFKKDNETAVCYDSRAYINTLGKVRNPTDLQSIEALSLLEYAWNENRDIFTPIIGSVATAYGTWISNVISGKSFIEPEVRERLRVGLTLVYISYAYYDPSLHFTESRKAVIIKQLQRAGKILPQVIDDIFEMENDEGVDILGILSSVKEPYRLEAFIEWFMNANDLEHLNITSSTLRSIVTNSWIGNLSSELCLAALEHPPVLTVMALQVLKYSFLERSIIGSSIRTVKTKTEIGNLTRWYKGLEATV